MPRTVLAAPLFNHAAQLREAVESLQAQTERDFALLLIDDASTDGTAELAAELAAGDPRITVHVNPRRLGMLHNTRRAWQLARASHPEAEFWALASDHDVWQPDWLARLTGALDAHPGTVLAYPRTQRIDAAGDVLPGVGAWRCETVGLDDGRARLRRAYRCMVAGDMVYGLFRVSALAQVPMYRPVLVPDRLMLAELALLGPFVQVPEVLWSRRYAGLADLERQRRAFWPDGAPRSARLLPWWVVHAGAVAREGRWELAADLLMLGARLRLRRRRQGVRRRIGAGLEAPALAALSASPAFRSAVARGDVPVPPDTLEVLRRLAAELEPDAGPARPGAPAARTRSASG
jgi:hypothetical protein